ncbi:hypothetical protein Leryth_021942 [Lithospermum erythrorhizon]|nr:hypothetical protein Leryth_021942 [Lithospermum erythrorhizon]
MPIKESWLKLLEMKNMKKTRNDKNSEAPKQKERHIVSWTSEEDDILREQIEKNGTDNWTIIASKFQDKTTRQCRRRWYTYLNSDFKKGGWSPEEDLLLCEAQKLFGNRWTEIAKVVSGRTDNAVKNRFSTLCKKRAKHEALAKENNAFVNLNNKRVIFPNGLNIDGISESAVQQKKMRSNVSSTSEAQCSAGKQTEECVKINQLLRPPFTVVTESFQTEATSVLIQQQNNKHEEISSVSGAVANNKAQGTFLKKDDPRILVLVQQEEILSSLDLKVNSEDTDQRLANAWQVLEDHLHQTKDGNQANTYTSCDPFNFKESAGDWSSNECSHISLRQPDHHTSSPSNSEYSTGSTQLTQPDYGRAENSKAEHSAPILQGIEAELHSTSRADQRDRLSVSDPVQENGIAVFENTDMELSSPIQVTPLFRSLAAAIPTPNFSESERHFLLRALGLESISPNPSSNPTTPQCKRVLLQSL